MKIGFATTSEEQETALQAHYGFGVEELNRRAAMLGMLINPLSDDNPVLGITLLTDTLYRLLSIVKLIQPDYSVAEVMAAIGNEAVRSVDQRVAHMVSEMTAEMTKQ